MMRRDTLNTRSSSGYRLRAGYDRRVARRRGCGLPAWGRDRAPGGRGVAGGDRWYRDLPLAIGQQVEMILALRAGVAESFDQAVPLSASFGEARRAEAIA
jgi:hypothetical protein